MHAHDWCNLQRYYAREFIDQKDFASSYEIVSQHFSEDEENIREAEWLAGWLALRYLNKPNLALKHFKKFSTAAHKPISISRGKYWIARTYKTKHDIENSVKFYKEAAAYPYTFYGQLAHLELKQNKITLPTPPKPQLHHKKSIEDNDIVKAAKLLIKYGKPELAHVYAKAAIEEVKTSAEILLVAQIINAHSIPYYMVEIGKAASYQGVFIKDYAFPAPYKISNSPVDAAITYSIIRQETQFNQHAVSNKNAMGLMQLVKDTACRRAKAIGVKCDIGKLTKDPIYNIKLGSNELSTLIKERNGSLILTFASYNTASSNVNKWIKRFGDPRELVDIYDVIDWIELIPFHETRNYVQRVLENIQVYRAILNKDSILKLRQDLGL